LVATWNGRQWRLVFNFTVTISINKGVKIFRLKLFSTLMPSTGQSNIIALFGVEGCKQKNDFNPF
jgi:hypothetical protein